MAEKIDFTKTLESLRARRGEFRVLELPELAFLMIDGHGDPNSSPAYAEALAALYPVAYALKSASRRELGRDYVVPPLEGLWWADDPSAFTIARDKSRWSWTMMIMTPDWLGGAAVDAALAHAGRRNPPTRLDEVRFGSLADGRCVQTLHIGSFDDESAVLAELHEEFLPAHGLRPTGRHHEVYLSDARRTAPERLRTILRQPVAAVD